MNAKTAWDSFKHTGSVKDYLIYTQLRQADADRQTQEDQQDENGCRGPGRQGAMRG